MMRGILQLAVVLLCIAYASTDFVCNREAGLCKNGGTCQADGTCLCLATFRGYDCSLKDGDTCTMVCNNNGTCYTEADNTTEACLCDPMYVGHNCTDKRYQVTCAGMEIQSLSVTPHVTSFVGSLMVEAGQEAGCKSVAAPPSVTSLLNAGDPNCLKPATAGVGGSSYSRTFILRFIQDTMTKNDEYIIVTCGSGDTISKSTSVAVTSVTTTTDLKTVTEGAKVPTDADVDFELLDSNGAVVSSAVALGTVLTAKAKLTTLGAGRFQALRLESCMANSVVNADNATANNVSFTSHKFVEGSCPAMSLYSVFVGGQDKISRLPNRTEVSFDFQVFKFDSSTKVYIVCTIKACELSATCDPTDCTFNNTGTINGGVGRKKRAADTDEDKVLWRSYSILDPTVAKALKELKTTKACYQTWEMTATVVALSVALVVVVLICIILIIRAIMTRRTGGSYKEDVSESASTARFPHLPTMVSTKA